MNTIIFLFFGWCVTSIIVNGSIFDGFRNYLIVKYPFFGDLVSCTTCLGVWVGAMLFWSCLPFGVIDPLSPGRIPMWMNYLIFPFIQSGFGVITESLIIFLVKGTTVKGRKSE